MTENKLAYATRLHKRLAINEKRHSFLPMNRHRSSLEIILSSETAIEMLSPEYSLIVPKPSLGDKFRESYTMATQTPIHC